MKNTFEKAIMVSMAAITLCFTMIFGSKLLTNEVKPENQYVQNTQIQVESNMPNLQPEQVKMTYVYYYRTYKGWVQRRKWNCTLGCWVDARWINVKQAR